MLRISRGLQKVLPPTLLDLVFTPFRQQFKESFTTRHAFRSRQLSTTLPDNPQHLFSLRHAIGERNSSEIRQIHREMCKNHTLGTLTNRELYTLSFVLDEHIQNSPQSETDEYDKEMAIHCAAHGYIDPLKTFMLLDFKSNNYDEVISLYDQYFTEYGRVSSRSSEIGTSTLDPMSDDVVLLDDNIEIKHTPSDVTDLVVLMIAAHAAKETFDGAYLRFMDSPTMVRITTPKIIAFCDAHLTHNPDLANNLEVWSQELFLCRLISRQNSFDMYVKNLLKDNHIIALEKLYQRIIDYCDDPHKVMCLVQPSPEELDNSKQLTVPDDTWASFIRAFIQCNRHDLIGKLWVDLKSRGLVPSRYIRNALLEGFGRYGHLDKAIAVWKDMLSAGIEPNDISYGAMIQAYFHNRKPAEALAMFDQFRKNARTSPGGKEMLQQNSLLPLYNIVLHGLLINKSFQNARDMLKELQKHGPKPDIVTYNIFLRFYGRIGDLQALDNMLQEMKGLGVSPDVYSFTTILSALYRKGKLDAHKRLLNIMMSMGVQPNVAMYSAIINFLVREGGYGNLRNAVLLLHHMEHDADKASRPNEVTYTALLAGIHRDPTLTRDEVDSYTEDIFGKMQRSGIQPNRTTYHYLIKACLENPDIRALQTGLRFYREMEKRGIITNRTWYVILSSLLRRGDFDTAGGIVNDMLRKGYQPDESLRVLIEVQKQAAYQS
ncbi:hypothetical protein Clacol_003015 [Clathrus columnatus]|uniref:Pentatricopeptide repeat-containing protein n=1 Tax=Clathrus columnatus TaxID=1419009 RepID=A0AAV5A8A9_9AGAM|nr:hypothetical protein Clacol_003015 [Clathrus columnatus]